MSMPPQYPQAGPLSAAWQKVMVPLLESRGWPEPEARARELFEIFSDKIPSATNSIKIIYMISLRPGDEGRNEWPPTP